MPRRSNPSPLGQLLAQRLAQLRKVDGSDKKQPLGLSGDGIGRQQVWALEGGRSEPMVATQFSIARALDIEPYQLAVFPGHNAHHELVDLTRLVSEDEARELVKWIRERYEAPPVEKPIADWRDAVTPSSANEETPARRAPRAKPAGAKKRGKR